MFECVREQHAQVNMHFYLYIHYTYVKYLLQVRLQLHAYTYYTCMDGIVYVRREQRFSNNALWSFKVKFKLAKV